MRVFTFKNLLNLLASSASFIALLLATNTAIAAPSMSDVILNNVSQPEQQYFSLSIANPQLQLTHQDSKQLAQHLGCSCSFCTQVTINTTSGK